MTKQTDDRIAALERELVALKTAQAPPTPAPSEQEIGKWRDEMHALAEARANRFVTLSPERRRAMERACSTEDLRDLVHASHRPQGPSQAGASGQITGVHPGGGARFVPGGGTGWREATPLGPQPGIRYVDTQLDAQDARDRAERVAQEARTR